jgi:hypothetical protein
LWISDSGESNPAAAGLMPSRNTVSVVAIAIFIGFICIGRYRTVRPQDITDLPESEKPHA